MLVKSLFCVSLYTSTQRGPSRVQRNSLQQFNHAHVSAKAVITRLHEDDITLDKRLCSHLGTVCCWCDSITLFWPQIRAGSHGEYVIDMTVWRYSFMWPAGWKVSDGEAYSWRAPKISTCWPEIPRLLWGTRILRHIIRAYPGRVDPGFAVLAWCYFLAYQFPSHESKSAGLWHHDSLFPPHTIWCPYSGLAEDPPNIYCSEPLWVWFAFLIFPRSFWV